MEKKHASTLDQEGIYKVFVQNVFRGSPFNGSASAACRHEPERGLQEHFALAFQKGGGKNISNISYLAVVIYELGK